MQIIDWPFWLNDKTNRNADTIKRTDRLFHDNFVYKKHERKKYIMLSCSAGVLRKVYQDKHGKTEGSSKVECPVRKLSTPQIRIEVRKNRFWFWMT